MYRMSALWLCTVLECTAEKQLICHHCLILHWALCIFPCIPDFSMLERLCRFEHQIESYLCSSLAVRISLIKDSAAFSVLSSDLSHLDQLRLKFLSSLLPVSVAGGLAAFSHEKAINLHDSSLFPMAVSERKPLSVSDCLWKRSSSLSSWDICAYYPSLLLSAWPLHCTAVTEVSAFLLSLLAITLYLVSSSSLASAA